MKKNISTQAATISSNLQSLDWLTICKEIEAKLGKDIYESWVKKLKLVEEFQHYLVLSSPTRFIRDWVVSRYIDKILEIVKLYKKDVSRIDFIIESKLSVNSNNVSDQNLKIVKESKTSQVSFIEESLINYTHLDPNKSFENFVIGKSNNLAYQASQKVCEQIAHYNPLFIYGEIGMGKTHLLNAIGLNMRKNNKVMFISAERFMYHFIKSIRSNEMVKFKDSFRTSDLFIIDDIQFVIGKEAMQEEFFHTFNALIDRGSQIVISSDRAPIKLTKIQERIKSRFSGGLVVDIQQSDFDLRLDILKSTINKIKKSFSDIIEPDENLLNFIASEMKTNIRETIGALNRIISFSRIYKKSPSISESKIILKDLINFSENHVTIEYIKKTVCDYFKINVSEMLLPRRSRYLVRPRQIAMYLTKNLTSKSLPDIGREFSGRDHTTVIHSVKTIDKLKGRDEEISKAIEKLKNKILYKNHNEV
jgi:chromosomal replication initiator protein